jgi:hypothetical protein
MPVNSKILASHGSVCGRGRLSSLSCIRITSAILVSIEGFETDERGINLILPVVGRRFPRTSKGREQLRLSPFFSRRDRCYSSPAGQSVTQGTRSGVNG